MTNEDIIAKTFWNTVAEILGKEKENAIQSESYGDAIAAGILEGICQSIAQRL